MKETVVQKELADALRAAGCWVRKWPDAAVSRMVAAADGRMRFTLPKPCDLIGCAPDGRMLAIEVKLLRARSFRSDAHIARQVQELVDLQFHHALTALALNFRFTSARPPERVNRLFLLWSPSPARWAAGQPWGLALLEGIATEVPRQTGGWAFSPSAHFPAATP